MAGSREALIVAIGRYEDEALRQLRSPAQDAKALGRVLGAPDIGGFTVQQVIDEDDSTVRLRLFEFFAKRSLDDLLLVHLSCHGIKDDNGRLYFAATNTRRHALKATAVSSSFLHEQMEDCRARSIVLLLDCCYAGAFASGAKGDDGVHLKEKLVGQGRAILTASNAIEYAWEGSHLSGTGMPSVFTDAIVNGLETGEADLNGDGRVSIHELHEHITERMLRVTPKQTPLKWELGVEGGLFVARNPRVLDDGRQPPPPPRPQPQPASQPQPKPDLPVRPLLATAAVLVVMVAAAVLLPFGAGDRIVEEVRVPATFAWTDTTVDLEIGDRLSITAEGVLRDNVIDRPEREFTPDGEPDTAGEHPGDPHRGLNHAALVGQIGDGRVFAVGSGHEQTVERAGTLRLGINDSILDDNAGQFVAEIEVDRTREPSP